MKELFKRIFGYFGREGKKEGPSVLGMETQFHEHIPDPEEIRKAVKEAKELFRQEENQLRNERLD